MKPKQTSVEWLSNKAYELFEKYSEGKIDMITLNINWFNVTNEANAMHEEEIEQLKAERSAAILEVCRLTETLIQHLNNI